LLYDVNKCPYSEKKCEDIGCPCPKYFAYEDVKNPEKLKEILQTEGFDLNLPGWKLMYQMQTKFASRFHDLENITKESIDTWVDKYLVCIDDELREVREWLSLYGENKSFNQKELQKEAIDILHFVMDTFICAGATADDIEHAYINRYANEIHEFDEHHVNDELKQTQDLVKFAYLLQESSINEYLNIYSIDNKDFSILKACCKLSDACGLVRQQISWKHWKKPNPKINMDKLQDAFALLFHELINLFILTMNCNEIQFIYITKNAENIQRQVYGY
jgi:hypothetical protein